jgi:hypothetical protein
MQTDFLYARPNFLSGFASVIDIGGTLIEYNNSRNEVEADLRALASDWIITGKDIQNNVEKTEKEESPLQGKQ